MSDNQIDVLIIGDEILSGKREDKHFKKMLEIAKNITTKFLLLHTLQIHLILLSYLFKIILIKFYLVSEV